VYGSGPESFGTTKISGPVPTRESSPHPQLIPCFGCWRSSAARQVRAEARPRRSCSTHGLFSSVDV
jgi:hypothetical protein